MHICTDITNRDGGRHAVNRSGYNKRCNSQKENHLLMLTVRNNGRLSARKRDYFSALASGAAAAGLHAWKRVKPNRKGAGAAAAALGAYALQRMGNSVNKRVGVGYGAGPTGRYKGLFSQRKKRKGFKRYRSLGSRVRALQRGMRRLQPRKQIIRNYESGALTANIGQTGYLTVNVGHLADMQTVEAGFYRLTAANTVTAATFPIDSGDFRLKIKAIKKTTWIKNNSNSEAHIELMWVKCKTDPTINYVSESHQNIADEGSLVPLADLRFSPPMATTTKWKLLKTQKLRLKPGESFRFNVMINNIIISNDYTTDHPNNYNPHTMECVLRLHGDLAHDSTTSTEVSTDSCTLDYMIFSTYVLEPSVNTTWPHHENVGGAIGTVATPQVVNPDDPNVVV